LSQRKRNFWEYFKMHSKKYAKELFLKIAYAFYEKKLEHRKKIEKLIMLEKELLLAEDILDSLSEQKTIDVHILLKVNSKIAKLKERISFLKKEKEIKIY